MSRDRFHALFMAAFVVCCAGALILGSIGWLALVGGLFGLFLGVVLRLRLDWAEPRLGSALHNTLSGLGFTGMGLSMLLQLKGAPEAVMAVASVVCVLAGILVMLREQRRIPSAPVGRDD